MRKHGKMTIRMAYEMVMPYHLHMPSYFLETFTEYPSPKLAELTPKAMEIERIRSFKLRDRIEKA